MTTHVTHYATCGYYWNGICSCGIDGIAIAKRVELPMPEVKVDPDRTPYYRRFERRSKK